jgi:transposase-like protein
MRRRRQLPVLAVELSAFAGFRFPPEVVVFAVRWYLRFGLSYRDLEELLAERGIEVDHVTLFRWVQRFTPLLVEAGRPCRHAVGCRWFVDETYVKGVRPVALRVPGRRRTRPGDRRVRIDPP